MIKLNLLSPYKSRVFKLKCNMSCKPLVEFKVLPTKQNNISTEVGLGPKLGEVIIKKKLVESNVLSPQPNAGISLLTPSCLYYSQGANLVPHLTPDMCETLNNESINSIKNEGLESGTNTEYQPCIKHTSLDHFVNVPGYLETEKTFSEFNSSEEHFILLDIHDPNLNFSKQTDALKPWKSGNKFATLSTTNGLHKLTPDSHSQLLKKFKPEVAVILYDCIPNPIRNYNLENTMQPDVEDPTFKRTTKTLERSSKWAEIVLNNKDASETSYIGAVLGGSFLDLRSRSAVQARSLGDRLSGYLVTNFHGDEEAVINQLRQSIKELNSNQASLKPIFSWDFNSPREIILAIRNGVDVFSTIYPYLAAEHGHALTFEVPSLEDSSISFSSENPVFLNLNRPTSEHISEFQNDPSPISHTCSCYCCQKKFSKAYIVHLLNTHEMLAQVLLMSHNMQHFLDFFAQIRLFIHEEQFEAFAKSFLKQYESVDWFNFLTAELTNPKPRPSTPL